MFRKGWIMATDPPIEPPHSHQRVVIDLPSWKLITTAAIIITTLAGFGAAFLKLSLNALEANMRGEIRASIAPVNDRTLMFKMMLADMINNKELSPQMKQFYLDSLGKISLNEIKDGMEPSNTEKRSLNALERDRKVTSDGRIDGKNGDRYVRVRFFNSNDPRLDLSKIDLVSDPPSPCSSRVVDLPGVDNYDVQVCEAHLGSGLEVIAVKKSKQTAAF